MGAETVYGPVLVLFGGLAAAYPRKVARFNEQLDAIGSTRSMSEVEPAGWNVALTRVTGAAALLVGIVLVLVALGV